jgi:hypothetical protein
MPQQRVRYSYQTAFDNMESRHAQAVIRDFAKLYNFKIIDAESIPIADCWIFTIEGNKFPEHWPPFVTVIEE